MDYLPWQPAAAPFVEETGCSLFSDRFNRDIQSFHYFRISFPNTRMR